MAKTQIAACTLYYNGANPIAEVENGTLDVITNDEACFGLNGYVGHSDGATMMRIEATCIIPYAGMSIGVVNDMLARTYITVGVRVEGKVFQTDMRIIQASYNWESKTGKVTGKFTFEGGQPDVTSI